MSDPRGGPQARSFHDTLTSRAIPEAQQDGEDRRDSPAPPETQPEAAQPANSPPPAWAADIAVPDDIAPTWEGVAEALARPTPSPNNIMLHSYRTLDAAELDALGQVKDLALSLWNTLKFIDQSSAEDGDFQSRTLSEAGKRLEECVLWVEKHFLGG